VTINLCREHLGDRPGIRIVEATVSLTTLCAFAVRAIVRGLAIIGFPGFDRGMREVDRGGMHRLTVVIRGHGWGAWNEINPGIEVCSVDLGAVRDGLHLGRIVSISAVELRPLNGIGIIVKSRESLSGELPPYKARNPEYGQNTRDHHPRY